MMFQKYTLEYLNLIFSYKRHFTTHQNESILAQLCFDGYVHLRTAPLVALPRRARGGHDVCFVWYYELLHGRPAAALHGEQCDRPTAVPVGDWRLCVCGWVQKGGRCV